LRLATFAVTALAVGVLMCAPTALAASLDPQALASSLQSDAVQSIGVPSSSFSALSQSQLDSLRAEIAKRDPGRIWILVVSPRSQSALAALADPLFGDLPAGTLIAVAEEPQHPNTTNFWVGSSWQSSDAAQAQLNNVVNAYHKGQGSLYDDLRLEIKSFARGDAAAGHPALSSGGNGSQQPGTAGGGSGSGGLIAALIAAGLVLLAVAIFGGRSMRGAMRASHRRREENTDAQAQARADFGKLGEQIEALDIDSSMPGASAAGKAEYAKAIECYEDAERRLKQSGDEYQFGRAVDAISRGLEHCRAASQLFNPAPARSPQPAEVVDKLAQLAALHDRGELTDSEFAQQKRRLLDA
jgi:hypothetical protein